MVGYAVKLPHPSTISRARMSMKRKGKDLEISRVKTSPIRSHSYFQPITERVILIRPLAKHIYNVNIVAVAAPPLPSTHLRRRDPLMMIRHQLARSALRARRRTSFNALRTFTSTSSRPAEVELTVDGKKVSVEAGSALIQACEKAGSTVPRFCYHE